jgi:hypothetical protein
MAESRLGNSVYSISRILLTVKVGMKRTFPEWSRLLGMHLAQRAYGALGLGSL